ncbi:hypothetical protein AMS68_001726 [Peltaster fructicola]|uniref:DUF6987 domain-containing protein n=1 Tax=Peltaster fructicola TaxID=286661 RepID=A0A6H0XNK5_9PEZI|nr:hypothetical protein AMS68_001726 [Peltaster fructicola]
MTSDSNSYAYYSFPRTPPRLTPNTSRSSSKTDTFHTPHTTPTRAAFDRGEMSTASASAKNQGGPPKTPTKLNRKPAPMSSAKSGSKDQSNKSSTPSGKSAAGDAKQSLDDKKSSAKGISGKADKTTSDTKDQAKGAADNAKGLANDLQDKAKDTAQGASSESQDDDEPLSKVSQAAEESSGDLKDAAPVPIPDDEEEAEDATAGADASGKDDITDAADEAADQTKDQAAKATDQAKGAAKETTDKTQDAAKQTTDKAKDAAEDAPEKAQDAAKETTSKSQDAAKETTDKAQDTAKEATDKAQDTAKKSSDKTKGAAEAAKDQVEDTTSGATDKAPDTSQAADDADDIPDDVTEKAGALGETSADETGDAQSQAGDGGLLEGAKGLAGRASAVAGRNAKKPAQQATNTADETASGAQETGEKAKSGAEDAADDAQEGTEDAPEDAEQPGQDTKNTTDNEADEAQGSAEDTSKQVEGATKEGEEATADVAEGDDQAQDAGEDGDQGDEAAQDHDASVPENLPLDMSVLNGLEVQSDGRVLNSDGEQIGRLVEGDAEDLEGYPIHEGEILDEDGDLVGRVELLPEEIKRQLQQAKDDGVELPEGADEYLDHLDDDNEEDEGPALPGLDILEGLTCGVDGLVYDDDGNTVGKVVEGDPEDLQHAKLNSQGEFVDDDGNVVGRAEIHEEAAELVEQGVYDAAEPEEAQEGAEGVQEITEETQEETDKAAEGIEDELPGIEALQGRELNESGEIVDESGDVLGQIQDEELKEKIESGEIDPNKLSINEKGEVVDEDNNVLGSTELVEGAAEKLANIAPTYDVRILEGRKVNKKSKVLDDDGEEIGQLVEGDVSQCAGQKINEKGEVVDKKGKVIGKVKVSEGEAAQEATKQLLEELGENGQEADGDLPGLETLEGLKVNKKGQVLNEDGEPIGELVEGELSECASKKCNDKGEVLDKDGNVIGRVKTLAPQTEEAEPEQEQDDEQNEDNQDGVEEQAEDDGLPPLSILEGLKVNKAGRVLDSNGNIIGELIEGDAKKLSKSGLTCDAEGQFWDNKGHVIGKAKTTAQEDADEESPFAGLDGLKVVEGGWVQDSEGNKVGRVTEGDAKKLVGRSVDEDGDILNNKGSVVGHAERYEEEEEEVQEEAPVDLSFLQGKTVNKAGLVMSDGVPVARVVEGNPKEMANRKLDDQGQIWNDSGKVIGKVELIPEDERESKPEGPFAGLEGLRVIKEGKVADKEENVVGIIVEGDAKRLVGLAVDEDGDIADKYGNVKGHAEPYEEPEEEEPEAADLSALANTTINKAGHAVDGNGSIIGHIVEGEAKNLVGKKVDGQGQIWDDAGNVIGRCELSKGEGNAEDGPFAGFEGLKVQKDGTVTTATGDIVGRVVEGDIKKLVSHSVDDDGDILNKNGNKLGRAERWEPEEKERRKNPMSGLRINKEGEVRNQDGDLVGRLTDGALGHCVGQEIDDNGNVVDQDGNKIGEATLLENIVEEEYEGPSEEELEEARKRDEEREIANKMANICQQTLERMQPICKQISEHMEAADRTPKDELDEEDLVNKVKPLIEEGGRILQECNGSLRGLDPDGHIAAQAKGRAGSNEATPEEYRLAETLKELTTTVVTTIDSAKKKLNDMPHAKKKLNPLWGLLTQPLFQILAAVGLLLAGVLGLVGQLLNGLGLGGLVNGLLGGLGIDKLLASFGLGGGGGGDKKKKGNPIGSLPVIGGLLGGK